MDHEAPAIDVRDLSRSFRSGRRRNRRTVMAARAVSFSVAVGERIAFIGPNGAGTSK